jgi:hypothetical protein
MAGSCPMDSISEGDPEPSFIYDRFGAAILDHYRPDAAGGEGQLYVV